LFLKITLVASNTHADHSCIIVLVPYGWSLERVQRCTVWHWWRFYGKRR